ncbi:MAG: hypothetical protein QGG42_12095 [Phycisphaerae bacterium]|jgi:5'-3' exonuclease|nr:hypothetical protein [Phycisphaerae bacterium]
MKALNRLVCVLVVMLVCLSARGQEARSKTADAAANKAKIAALQKELSAAEAKMYAAFRKIEKNEAIVDLRKAALAADRAYQRAKESDPVVLAAKAAVRETDRVTDELVMKKVKASPAGAALVKEKIALDNKRAAFGLQIALAEVKLTHDDSPIVRAVNADPIVAQYKRVYYAASGTSRDTARADYYKLKKATLEDMPAAQALLAEIKTAKADEDAAEEAMDAVDKKISKLRYAAAKSDDPELVAARAKETAAREAYEKAYYGGNMKILRDKREQTRDAVRTGIKEIIAGDPDLSALSEKITQLGAEIKKLGGRRSRSSKRH